MNKRKISRVSAFLCAAALAVSALNFEPFTSLLEPTLVANADSAGGTGGDSGSGLGGTSTINSGYCLSGYGTGYRIYLVPEKIWVQRDDAVTDNYTFGVTEDSVRWLDDYHCMAMYEISDNTDTGNINSAKAVNSCNATLYAFNVVSEKKSGGTGTVKTLTQEAVPQNQILSTDEGTNPSPDFEELFAGTQALLPCSTTLDIWGDTKYVSYDLVTLSNWADERFMDLDNHEAAVTKILQNYKSQFDNNEVWDNMGYPSDYSSFVANQWAIIVEPVVLMALYDQPNVYAVSYQDYLALELGDPIDSGNGGQLDRTQFDVQMGGATYGGTSDDLMSNIYNGNCYYTFANNGKNRFAMSAFFYNDFSFTAADGSTISINTAPKKNGSQTNDLAYVSSNLKSAAPTSGFGLYTAWNGILLNGGGVSTNQNYWVVPSGDYKFAAAKAETDEDSQYGMFTFVKGDGQISHSAAFTPVGSKMLISDLLSNKTGLAGISNQYLNSADKIKEITGETNSAQPAKAGVEAFSNLISEGDWGNQKFGAMYPKARLFNYEHKSKAWCVTSFASSKGTSISSKDSFSTASSKIVAGDTTSSKTYDNEDAGYYLKTFYASTYQYNCSSDNKQSLDWLRVTSNNTSDYLFSFYVFPNANLTVSDGQRGSDGVGEEATRVFYAGSKFSAGLIDNYSGSAMANYLMSKNTAGYSMNGGVTFYSGKSLLAAPSYNLFAKEGYIKANNCGVMSDDAWNFATELSMYALANSNVKAKASSSSPATISRSDANAKTCVSDSVEVLCKDKKVTSYLTYGGRDNDNNVYSGKYATLDSEGNPTYTDKEVTSFTYSVVDAPVSGITDIAKIEAKSQDSKPVFFVAIPNSEEKDGVGAYGYDLSKVDASKFYTDFFNAIKSNGLSNYSLNSSVGINVLAKALKAINVQRDNCVIKLCTSSTASDEMTKLVLGAYGGNKGKATTLKGYSIYVIEDFQSGSAIDCEGELKAYELNFLYPTILCDTTDARLIQYRVADTSGETKVSKTASYDGDLIRFNAANKIALLNFNNGTKGNPFAGNLPILTFANEQTDPKIFTYDTMVYDYGNYYENVDYKIASSLVTHAVNLTRGAFGDEAVISSLSKRDATLTAEYISQLGVTTGNKGRNTVDASDTVLLKTNYDIFRWSANKGLPLSMNGQMVYVSPFGSQPMQSAGYNLTTRGYAYIPNDRATGDSVTTGVLTGSLVVPQNGTVSYKMLSTEAYNDVLKFYPEFKMVTYVFNKDISDGEVTKEPTRIFTYMMADKVRSVKAAGLYSISTNSQANPLSGTVKSDTVATGSAAKALSQRLGGLQVVYAGGNINLATQNNFEINLGGFVLDQIDKSQDSSGNLIGEQGTVTYTDIIADGSDIKNVWGNGAYDAASKYSAWVADVKSKIAVSPMLTTYNNGRVVKEYTGYKANMGTITGGEVTGVTTYVLTFRNGALVEDTAYNALIKAIAVESCGNDNPTAEQIATAKEDFKKSNIATSILSSIESNTNADNKSELAEEFGNKKWYDEEVRSFVIRQFHTKPLTIGSVVVSDKIDINAGPSQTGTTAADLFSNGYVAKWGMTFYFKEKLSTLPNMEVYNPSRGNLDASCQTGGVIAYNVPVKGADFIISDATTSDARN